MVFHALASLGPSSCQSFMLELSNYCPQAELHVKMCRLRLGERRPCLEAGLVTKKVAVDAVVPLKHG